MLVVPVSTHRLTGPSIEAPTGLPEPRQGRLKVAGSLCLAGRTSALSRSAVASATMLAPMGPSAAPQPVSLPHGRRPKFSAKCARDGLLTQTETGHSSPRIITGSNA